MLPRPYWQNVLCLSPFETPSPEFQTLNPLSLPLLNSLPHLHPTCLLSTIALQTIPFCISPGSSAPSEIHLAPHPSSHLHDGAGPLHVQLRDVSLVPLLSLQATPSIDPGTHHQTLPRLATKFSQKSLDFHRNYPILKDFIEQNTHNILSYVFNKTCTPNLRTTPAWFLISPAPQRRRPHH